MSAGLIEGTILLGAALVFVLLFRKLGLGAVLGYLVAGALVGPDGLGLVGGGESKLYFAELGIALLLFLVGLELSPERLWRLRKEIFGLGLLQVLLCGAALFAFIFVTMGFTWAAALVVGLPLALSSTAQVLPGLKSSGRINSPFGERAFSILLLQDLSLIPLITVVAALSRAPVDPDAPSGLTLAFYSLAAIAGLVLAGRVILRPLLRLVGRVGDRELFVVVGLFAVIAASALMYSLGLSIALGAFIAGVMLADSPYRHELELDVEPFRSILLGLFFLAVGMLLDLDVIVAQPLMVIGLAFAVVAIKTVVIWALASAFGMAPRPALSLALLLSQGGEFGFILFSQAQVALLIAPEAASLFTAVVTLSMVTTPFLMLFARRLEYEADGSSGAELSGPDNAPRGRAIVVGYGRFGQMVAQMLHAVDCSVTLIDKKPQQIELSGRFNVTVYYGDGLRLDVLRQAGAESAQLIAFCIDDRSLSKAALKQIAKAYPQAQLLVRTFDRRHLIDLNGAPIRFAVREVYESAIAMGLVALDAIGIKAEEIAEAERAVRGLDEARLAAQIASGDLAAARHLRFTAESNPQPKEVLELLVERLAGDRG
jgi:CPA2 family monovalent cation:H+ antiporter-2